MTRRSWAFVTALCLAAVLAVPAAFADPPGRGLFSGQHVSDCTGAPLPGGAYHGYVTLLPSGGATFWVNGVHLVIQFYDYTPDGGSTVRYSVGQGGRLGLAQVPTVVCQGHFDEGYSIRSTSIAVP